jgi:hypothetical protein
MIKTTAKRLYQCDGSYINHDRFGERYIQAVPTTVFCIGQRLPVTITDARAAINNVRDLAEALISTP